MITVMGHEEKTGVNKQEIRKVDTDNKEKGNKKDSNEYGRT